MIDIFIFAMDWIGGPKRAVWMDIMSNYFGSLWSFSSIIFAPAVTFQKLWAVDICVLKWSRWRVKLDFRANFHFFVKKTFYERRIFKLRYLFLFMNFIYVSVYLWIIHLSWFFLQDTCIINNWMNPKSPKYRKVDNSWSTYLYSLSE